ncbi:STAS domain-containing protein [Streptomyces sp. NPDC059679]|uniref:STAS domain-containing protein n=1 Tax=Streptomyces sp. NPDC059679 TaxID=3346903 RepID=UPI003686F683
MPHSSPAPNPDERQGILGPGSRLLNSFRRRRSATAGHAIVQLRGEITGANSERVGKHLQKVLSSRPALLEIDLRDVRCLSSDGAAALFAALRAAQRQGTRLVATHVRQQPLHTLKQLGLERALELYEGNGPPGSGGGAQ